MSFCWVNLNIIFSFIFHFFVFVHHLLPSNFIFFHFQLHFFHLQLHFRLFSFVFDSFPLFFIDFHGFPGFQVPRARKMKKNMIKT